MTLGLKDRETQDPHKGRPLNTLIHSQKTYYILQFRHIRLIFVLKDTYIKLHLTNTATGHI